MKRQHEVSNQRPLKPAALGLLVSLLLGACAATTQPPPASHPSSAPLSVGGGTHPAPTSGDGSKWVLTWQDNFTGTGVPPGWSFDVGGYGFGDKQLEWNSDDNAQLSESGGLVITADKGSEGHTCWYGTCQYTAAKIQTSFAQTYGRFEARIKLPSGKGLWPAFWMIPAANAKDPVTPGEIDIIETNNVQPYLVTGYVHDAKRFDYRAEKVLNLPVSSQFHTFGVDWTPSGITWTLDGKPYGHIAAYRNWPFDQPFIMLLDLAVGGSWPGPPDASTVFPAQMIVSWVRVYELASEGDR